MTNISGVFLGAAATLLAVGCFHVARKVYGWLVSFHTLILRGVRALEGLQQELAYVRGLTGGQLGGEMQVSGDPSEAHVHGPQPVTPIREGRQEVTFPKPYMDRFPQEPIPDAPFDKKDVELFEQDDSEMTEFERIENMRKQGMQAEEPNVEHPGITVEAP